jgi:hypothetical protein
MSVTRTMPPAIRPSPVAISIELYPDATLTKAQKNRASHATLGRARLKDRKG